MYKNIFLVQNNKKHISSLRLKGFTLLEMLISISLFTFVSMVAAASLVASQQLNKSQSSIRALYDNMYFVMEEVGREIRQGNSYYIDNADCPASECIIIEPYQDPATSFYKIKYKLVSGGIEKFNDVNSPGTFVSEGKMTNSNVNISYLKFQLYGNGTYAASDRQQPGVKIFLKGRSIAAPNTEFQLENFITKRGSDI